MNIPLPASRGHVRTFLTSLALGLAVAACGGDSSGGGGGQSGIVGEEVAKPGGGNFFVDPNESGGTSRLRIAEMFWARLVDVHDIAAFGNTSSVPVFEDFAISESIQDDGFNYMLETNPVTQKTRLVILRTDDPANPNDEFSVLLRQATQSLPPIAPKNDDGSDAGPFSFIARNSVLVIRFNDMLNDRGDAERDLVETVKVRTGYPPTTPFLARMMFDPNYGGLGSGDFHSTRILIDMTITEAESAELQTPIPINALGLPASLQTSGQPNVSVRIPSRVDFGAGQFQILTALGGSEMGTDSNAGPTDPSSPTFDVVRAMRAGNAVDVNNGFMVDQDRPQVLGGWPFTVNTGVQDPAGVAGVDFVLGSTFETVCRQAPAEGDVIQVNGLFLEVTEPAADPDGAGNVVLRARVLGDPLTNPGVLIGTGLYLLPYDAFSPVLSGCWVTFVPQPGIFPSFQVPTNAQTLVRFSEPMDPAGLTSFGSYQIINGDSTIPASAQNLVVGNVNPSVGLDRYVFTPLRPFAHQNGVEEDFHVSIEDAVDLAGNSLATQLPPVDFTIDPLAPTESNGGITLRFQSPDEVGPDGTGPDGFTDWRGQFTYDLSREIMQPRPVTYSQLPVDRNNPVPSLMLAFPPGSAGPLSPLGSKLQTVWRYADLGWSVRDETKYDVDVIGLNWSPVGGQVISDFYESFEIRLAHSVRLPDEDTAMGLPKRPTSGLFGSPNFFTENILVDPLSPQKIVHNRALGYELNPVDLFAASSGTQMMPYPFNREGAPTETYTWRDTTVLALGGDESAGIPLDIEQGAPLALEPTAGEIAGPGEVPSYGLPLLMEFRCFPSNTGIGLNSFDVSLAVALSSRPNFRAYSRGGVDTSGSQVFKNPDLELVPSGGFNPLSTPAGQPTNFDADNFFYIGQMDIVIAVSRVHSIWFDTTFTAPEYLAPVLEPGPDLLPTGTQILVDYRGASTFSSDAFNADSPFDSTQINPYGDITQGTVTFFNSEATWTNDIGQLDGARYVQMRLSFVNNIETQLAAELSAIGLAYVGG